MKSVRYLLIILSLSLSSLLTLGQAKKPTLMVVPSDVWCNQNGYMLEFDNEGSVQKLPDYKKAFQENSDLALVISKINGIMADRGFPLKNMESVLKSVADDDAIEGLASSKSSGESASESPVDKLLSTARADIILQLGWTVNKVGPKKSITFNLQGLDAYTNKQVATAAGTGAPSFSAELPLLLEEAVISYMDDFTASLQDHFDDLFENGREITIRIRVWDDWGEDLESTFGRDDEELGILIEDWMADNTVEGRFSTSVATATLMVFEQVRIPLYYERNGRQRAMDTRRFAGNLRRLINDAYSIESKVLTKGLGQATLFLGSK